MSHRKLPVHIPRSELGAQLAETEAIKREMAELLRELEEQVTGRPITRPGVWRHHPEQWGNAAPSSGLKRARNPN